jgi:hypothetical protein
MTGFLHLLRLYSEWNKTTLATEPADAPKMHQMCVAGSASQD